MNPLIKLDRVCFTYPGDEEYQDMYALKDVSLEINEGEFVAILGHNGSGKSTTAKLINMILTPNSGTILVDGKDITSQEMTENDMFEIRKNVGMVFQNPDNQIVATIVEEDVAFGPENLGVAPNEIRKRVDDALATVGMSEYARFAPHKLSGGQKQRVAIAGILAMKPKCIVFDESTAMLDPSGRKEVMNTILKLNREEKITIVLITHYMNEAVLADRVIVMKKGSVAMEGTPSEVFSQPNRLWEAGLEVPQSVELLYQLNQEKGWNFPLGVYDDETVANLIKEKIDRN